MEEMNMLIRLNGIAVNISSMSGLQWSTSYYSKGRPGFTYPVWGDSSRQTAPRNDDTLSS